MRIRLYFSLCAIYLLTMPCLLLIWYWFLKWVLSDQPDLVWLPCPLLGSMLVLGYISSKFFISAINQKGDL